VKVVSPEPKDVHDWVHLVESFLAEGIDDYNFGFDRASCERAYFTWTNSQIGFFLERDGKKIGCIAGQVLPHAFNHTLLFFNEAMFYILPEHRGIGAIMLINAVKRECKKRGIQKMVMGHTASTPKVGLFYQRLGFKPLESHYVKDV
jgi:GNAT superfamily N-acetyltransferase